MDNDSQSELITVLTAITGRSKKNIQGSLEKLDRRDLLRITDLYKNYNKIEKYSKLVTDRTSLKKFKTELEKDIGKDLSRHQI